MIETPTLILASASPRRKELLLKVGCAFDIQAADVDESLREGETPEKYVRRLAEQKATTVHSNNPEAAVLAADTIVASDGEIFGKPQHQDHAIEMWQALSGQWHQVITAVCLQFRQVNETAVVSTEVNFTDLSEQQMLLYWQSGEPQDKAGGYAIQGLASAWVQEVRGSYSNVVGLPLFETNQILRLVGHNWL